MDPVLMSIAMGSGALLALVLAAIFAIRVWAGALPQGPLEALLEGSIATRDAWDPKDAWILGDPRRPLVRLAVSVEEGRLEPLDAPALRDFLHQLLELAPRALVSTAVSDRGYDLVLSPELRSGMGRTYELMRSGDGVLSAVVDGKGKIVGQARFVPHAMSPAVLTAMWSLASVATAQKFLADIDRRLAGLDEGVKRIRAWLDHELFADVEASVEHLGTLAASASAGRMSDTDRAAYAGTLEDIDLKNRKTMKHLALELAPIVSMVAEQRWSTWSGSGLMEVSTEAAQQLGRYGRLCEAWALAAGVRSFAASLRPAMGLDPGHAARLLQELSIDLEAFRAKHPRDLRERSAEKLEGMRGTFTVKTATTAAARAQVQAQLEQMLDPVATLLDELATATADSARRMAEDRGPLHLRVMVDAEGAVARVFERV